jgi:uncharacterized protein
VIALAAFAGLVACPEIVRFNERYVIVRNGVTMFELPAEDVNRIRRFYGDVFGWKYGPGTLGTITHAALEQGGENVQRAIIEVIPTPVSDNGFPLEPGLITGVISQRIKGLSNPTLYIEVDDMDEALSKLERCGGKVLLGRTEAGEAGFFAYFADTEGNVVGLWRDVVPGIRVGVTATT